MSQLKVQGQLNPGLQEEGVQRRSRNFEIRQRPDLDLRPLWVSKTLKQNTPAAFRLTAYHHARRRRAKRL